MTFQTAVAQAELEARDYPGHYHRVAFHGADGPIFIETTRPELIPSVVALIAHPDDQRYAALFGSTVTSPLFGVEVPVLAHPAAEPDKGAGIAMCCTFGDLTDVQWWRDLQLPTRSIITRTGRMQAETPEWLAGGPGAGLYAEGVSGKTAFSAREAIVTALRDSGDLDGEPTPTQRKANFYERGEKPLEIVTTRQWYIRNGGRRPISTPSSSGWVSPSPSARPSCRPVTRTGSPASPGTGWSHDSASSGCRSRSGIPSTSTARSTTTTRSCPPRATCRSTRPPTRPLVTRRRNAAYPVGSSATRTSSTPGPLPRSPRRSLPDGAARARTARRATVCQGL